MKEHAFFSINSISEFVSVITKNATRKNIANKPSRMQSIKKRSHGHFIYCDVTRIISIFFPLRKKE